MRIGVLALQGDFLEHSQMLRTLGAEVVEVRLPADLEGLDGLVIPGGESTTIARLLIRYDLLEPLRQRIKDLGFHLDDEGLNKVFEQFKVLADKKKTIFDADIEALAEAISPRI